MVPTTRTGKRAGNSLLLLAASLSPTLRIQRFSVTMWMPRFAAYSGGRNKWPASLCSLALHKPPFLDSRSVT
jgi:hypothetical protein